MWRRSLLASISCLALATSCRASEVSEPPKPPASEPAQTPAQTRAEPAEPSTSEPHAHFVLEAAASSELDWRPPSNLVSCRWYPEPERGDYLWIRLAQTPEQDGDAGPRLDIDVCRLRAGGSGRYAPMKAGEHGSHCADAPGFAIWWHEGEAAFNNGAVNEDGPAGCWLELEIDEGAATLAGRFSCAGLEPHEQGEGEVHDQLEPASVDVREGRFACQLEQVG